MGAAPAAALAQRSGNMRDPDQRYDEGWTSLFNGKEFGRLVALVRGEDGKPKRFFDDSMEKQSFLIEGGRLKTSGSRTDIFAPATFTTTMSFTSRSASRNAATAACWFT